MELIDQHTKRIMEGCKERARSAGLAFHDETLEYIVTNKDLLELGPKNMIPTFYDYWIHDVEVLKEKGRYELYPHNPYETVINTRPAISFYNDNNPDWLNVMIFYHVLAHIDFFQNNMLFKHTWDEDFAGQALSDKRFIAMLRSEKGRWVDYVIEFTRGVDNLVGFFEGLSRLNRPDAMHVSKKTDFYFDVFLQTGRSEKIGEYLKEIERYNECLRKQGDLAEAVFFSETAKKYPEFDALFRKHERERREGATDLIAYIEENSPFLQKSENQWMKSVMEIVRRASLFFQPQIRTKILNEGWASYWHERLFLEDDRIKGNEVAFARVNAMVTAMPRAGLNPYALGMRLFTCVEELADKGRLSYEFQKLQDAGKRRDFDRKTGRGRDFLFKIREDFSDFTFINTFVDEDFVDRYRLFVLGKRLNASKGVWEYYVKSRKSSDYRQMLLDHLYHPPHIDVDESRSNAQRLCLNHHFEGKPLLKEYLYNTMLGIAYLWGDTVELETSEREGNGVKLKSYEEAAPASEQDEERPFKRIRYRFQGRELTRTLL